MGTKRINGNHHRMIYTCLINECSSSSRSMLEMESARDVRSTVFVGETSNNLGSNPSLTIIVIFSPTLRNARTASWCVAPNKLCPFTYRQNNNANSHIAGATRGRRLHGRWRQETRYHKFSLHLLIFKECFVSQS
jgi:hypothetical protein